MGGSFPMQVVAGQNFRLSLEVSTYCRGRRSASLCPVTVYAHFTCSLRNVNCMKVSLDTLCKRLY